MPCVSLLIHTLQMEAGSTQEESDWINATEMNTDGTLSAPLFLFMFFLSLSLSLSLSSFFLSMTTFIFHRLCVVLQLLNLVDSSWMSELNWLSRAEEEVEEERSGDILLPLRILIEK